MTAGLSIEALLTRILPQGVAFSAGPVFDPGASRYRDEEDAVVSSVAKRRAEFRCGRLHARNALRRLGIADGPIPRRLDRTPIWPECALGSISHSDRSVVAIAALAGGFAALGVDVETAAPLEDALLSMVCSPSEIGAMNAAGVAPAAEGKLLFSIKEAVFKALFPLRLVEDGPILDFEDIAVSLDRRAGAFAAELTHPRHRAAVGSRPFMGRYGLAGGEVVAALCLTPEDFDAR